MNYSNKYKDIEIDVVNRYLNKETPTKIAKFYKLTPEIISYILNKNKIKRHGNKKYNFDENVFEKIDTKEKAYWLGFIFAEGNVHNNTLNLKLGQEDMDHLEKYKKFMKSNNKIEKRVNKKSHSYCVKIYSKKICFDLGKLGVIPNKSLTIDFPKIDYVFISSFLLGFFDGDGWISYEKKSNCWHIGFCSCSKIFIEKIRDYILSLNIGKAKGSFFSKKYKEKNWNDLYIYSLGGNISSFNVLRHLYDENKEVDSLSRKFEKFNDFKKFKGAY